MAAPAVSALLAAVAPPPIAQVRGWVAGRSFPADKPLLDLSQAAPAYPPPVALREHLARAVMEPGNHGYAPILGLPELREAYAAHQSEFYGGTVRPAEVAIAAGCNQAFCLAMLALAQAGDEVILPRPHYFNHDMWLAMLGIRPVPLDVRPEAGAVPSVEDAARLLSPRTRAIVLVTPNNPTGAVYPAETIEAFHALARKAGAALVLDETYKDFLPAGTRPHALFGDAGWREDVVHLYSFSKVYALAGHRVGAVTAAEPLIGAIQKAMDCVAICAPRLGQQAALYGLGHLGDWARGNAEAMQRRAQAFGRALAASNRWRLVSIGAYFAYVEHPFAGEPGLAVAQRLAERENLVAVPGSMFGAGQERFLRFAFANVGDAAIGEIMARIER